MQERKGIVQVRIFLPRYDNTLMSCLQETREAPRRCHSGIFSTQVASRSTAQDSQQCSSGAGQLWYLC